MIIQRYVFKEVLQALIAVLGVLLLIYISNRFVRYLAQAASGYISRDLVFDLMLLKLAENLSLLLPLALFLAVLLALGRLYRDSEMIAMAASGIGVRQVATSLLGLSLLFAVLTAVLSLYLSPMAARIQQELFERAKGDAQIAGVQAGQFRDFGSGHRVGYVESMSSDGREMRKIFVQMDRNDRQEVIVAETARLAFEGSEQTRYMVLDNGHRYIGQPGDLDYVITRFDRHAVRMEQSGGSNHGGLETRDSMSLLRDDGGASAAQLQWRLSIPISVVVLTLLAVVMARTTPRQGRYARLIVAFIIYFIYNNAIGIASKLVERGDVATYLGVWPVHLLFLTVILAVMHRQSAGRWVWQGPASSSRGFPA